MPLLKFYLIVHMEKKSIYGV